MLDNLRIRNCIEELELNMCPLCGVATEAVTYLFFSCSKMESIWKQWMSWLGIYAMLSEDIHMHIK